MENREVLKKTATWPKGITPIFEGDGVVELRVATKEGILHIRGTWDRLHVSKDVPEVPTVEPKEDL